MAVRSPAANLENISWAADIILASPERPALVKRRALNWAWIWSSLSAKVQPLAWALELTNSRLKDFNALRIWYGVSGILK